MSLQEIVVAVQRPARTGDGSGGKTIAWATVTGMSALTCTQNFYGRTSQLLRMEQAAHNAQGAGVATRALNLFVFRQQPAPAIKANDRIVDPAGQAWTVLTPPRKYASTLQVDTELVS